MCNIPLVYIILCIGIMTELTASLDRLITYIHVKLRYI